MDAAQGAARSVVFQVGPRSGCRPCAACGFQSPCLAWVPWGCLIRRTLKIIWNMPLKRACSHPALI